MMQRFEFKTKEGFTIYLWFLIRSSFIQTKAHRTYLSELQAIIKERNLDEPESRIPAMVYHALRDKIEFIACQLLNLMGDHADKAASYRKFRHEANKVNSELELVYNQ